MIKQEDLWSICNLCTGCWTQHIAHNMYRKKMSTLSWFDMAYNLSCISWLCLLNLVSTKRIWITFGTPLVTQEIIEIILNACTRACQFWSFQPLMVWHISLIIRSFFVFWFSFPFFPIPSIVVRIKPDVGYLLWFQIN